MTNRTESGVDWGRWLPAVSWARSYERGFLKDDLIAGLTTAVMLVPQGMAYALLAGLPPIVGLYASVVPLVLYALFGSSRQLAVGPVAMVSLLVLGGVSALNPADTAQFVAYAVVLALMVGVIQLAMGVFRAGFLVNFLSHPVISGFTSAAALIIGFNQLQHVIGVKLTRTHHIHSIVGEAWSQLGAANLWAAVIGITGVVLLVVLKRYAPKFPRALVVVVLGTLFVVLVGVDVRVVGEVPSGFPAPAIPLLEWATLKALLPSALTISLVSFMESISVAKAFAKKGGYTIDPNQELVGLGLANIGSAAFGGYPVTGGFSRTAVNAQAGARTPLASLITAGVIALVLVALTPLFEQLPKAVLAAIILTAVAGLVDWREVKHLWKVDRVDLGLLVLTFAATLALGIEPGILVGVSASMIVFVARSTRPHTAVLGRLPGTSIYRNVLNFREAEVRPGVLAVRIDASFYFGNVTFLKDKLRCLEAEAQVPVHTVVIDAASVNSLDSSADAALHEIAEDYARRGIALYFASVKGPVRAMMRRSGLWDVVGPSFMVESVEDAMPQLRIAA
jgi:sulfate permease, SulP family